MSLLISGEEFKKDLEALREKKEELAYEIVNQMMMKIKEKNYTDFLETIANGYSYEINFESSYVDDGNFIFEKVKEIIGDEYELKFSYCGNVATFYS